MGATQNLQQYDFPHVPFYSIAPICCFWIGQGQCWCVIRLSLLTKESVVRFGADEAFGSFFSGLAAKLKTTLSSSHMYS